MNTINNSYFIDIDGTIVHHLSELELEEALTIDNFTQELLSDVSHFFTNVDESNAIIFTTARTECYRQLTERTLKHHKIRYSHLIMNLPMGPRYIINDTLNIFYPKAIAINVMRNKGFTDTGIFDPET